MVAQKTSNQSAGEKTMSIQSLKTRNEQQIAANEDRRKELHAKLQEQMAIHFGWSTLPDIARLELRWMDYRTIANGIDAAIKQGNPADWFVSKTIELIEREKQQHCDLVSAPSSTNQFSNAFALIELEHKPQRWQLLQWAIEEAKRPE